MKFYNYLNESNGLNMKAFEKMVKDCKPFLKELKKSDYEFLYSGRKDVYQNFKKKKTRKRRRPKDTPIEIHNILDKSFKENFGVKARSESFFVSNNPYEVGEYGRVHYVFPVGNYKLIYSNKVQDLYRYIAHKISAEFGDSAEYFINVFGSSDDVEISGYNESEWKVEVKKLIDDIVKTYKQSKKIPTGLQVGYEIMLIADEVRLLSFDYNKKDEQEDLLIEWIKDAV